jgi:hypothetical protein
MFTLIYNGLCAQKFEDVQPFSKLQKPVCIKLNVCNIIILTDIKNFICMFQPHRIIKYKQEINILFYSYPMHFTMQISGCYFFWNSMFCAHFNFLYVLLSQPVFAHTHA